MHRHELIIGETGTGKTYELLRRTRKDMEDPTIGIWVLDPSGGLAELSGHVAHYFSNTRGHDGFGYAAELLRSLRVGDGRVTAQDGITRRVVVIDDINVVLHYGAAADPEFPDLLENVAGYGRKGFDVPTVLRVSAPNGRITTFGGRPILQADLLAGNAIELANSH